MNNETTIVSFFCVFLVLMFFLFKPQLFRLIDRLAKFEFGAIENIQYTDQDSEPELPTPSLPVLTREKFAVRIVIFIVLSYLIYIVPAYLSRMLVEFGNSEYSAGSERIGTASYNLALELNNELKKAIDQCSADNARQQYELAINDCSKAIEIDSNYVDAYSNRAMAYWNLEKYDQAISDYTKDTELIPMVTLYYLNRGVVYMAQKKYDLAIADYTKAIDINPKDPAAYLNRGQTYAAQQKNDLAIADFTKAIDIGIKDPAAYFNRGLAYAAQQKNDLAIADYTKTIDINPKDSTAHIDRGIAYASQNKYDFAIADFTKAIDINPKEPVAYLDRGITYTTQQKYDLAIADFTKSIELNPNYVTPYIWRGNVFADTKKFTQAISDYQKALSISSDSYTYCVQGVTYTKMNEFELAVTSLEQGVKMDDTSENNWCKLALENARVGIPTP